MGRVYCPTNLKRVLQEILEGHGQSQKFIG